MTSRIGTSFGHKERSFTILFTRNILSKKRTASGWTAEIELTMVAGRRAIAKNRQNAEAKVNILN